MNLTKLLTSFLILIFASVFTAEASSLRTLEGDTIKSSDHSKTWTMPSTAGTLQNSFANVFEVPSGTVNGSNVTFTLTYTPITNSVSVYLDGFIQTVGGENDYTISTATITFTTAPAKGQTVTVSYIK